MSKLKYTKDDNVVFYVDHSKMIKIIFETTNPWETQISKPKADMKPFDVGLTN